MLEGLFPIRKFENFFECSKLIAGMASSGRVSFLVIDEADALLEMGFIDQTSALVMQVQTQKCSFCDNLEKQFGSLDMCDFPWQFFW